MTSTAVAKFNPAISLRRRLVIFAMLCALPALAVVVLQFVLQTRSIQEDGRAAAEGVSTRLADRVERLLGSVENVVEAISILNIDVLAARDLCERAFQRAMQSNANVVNLSISAPSGEVLCSAKPVPPGTNVADRPYFQQVLTQKKSVVSGYTIGRVTGQEAVQLAVPILATDGAVRAVAIAAISPVDLTDRLINPGMAPMNVLLFDRDGILISKRTSVSSPDLQRGKSYAESPLFAKLRANDAPIVTMPGLDGKLRLFSLKQVVFEDQLVFYVSVGVDMEALSSAARQEGLLYLLVVLLTGGMVFFIAVASFRPLVLARTAALIRVAHAVSSGNYAERVPVQVRDEITPIEETVNAMLASVEQDKAHVLALSERNSLIAEATNDAIYDWNSTSGDFWCNRLPLQTPVAGEQGRALKLDDWFSVIHPQDQARVRALWSDAVSSGWEYWECRYRVVRDEGSVAYILERARLLRDASGALLRVVSGARDVTSQTLSELSLLESESRYRQLFESSLDGVMQTGVDGKVISANAAACLMLGRTEEELQALGRSGVVDLEDPRLPGLLEQREKTGKARGALTMIRGDGVRIEVELTSSVYLDREGRQVTSMVLRDTTERRKAEEQIRQLNQELESRVLQRTQQLELANRELEAFSYSVSHDLRGPLNTIDGFSKMLGDAVSQAGDERASHYLTRIRAGVKTMGELIDGLLSLAKVSRMTLHQEAVDLGEIAEAVIQNCHDQDPHRHVEITIDDKLQACGDPRLLNAMMSNLIGNAWKFTTWVEHAQIHIGQTMGADGSPVFFVRDNGAGFDMAHAHKLFGTFERLHSASDFPGSGIGLATVQRILQRHGGRAWAESAPEKGATFFFVLGKSGA